MIAMNNLTINGVEFNIVDANAVHFTEQGLAEEQQDLVRTNIGAASVADVNKLSEEIAESKFTSEEKKLLITILKAASFTSDVSESVKELENAWGLSDGYELVRVIDGSELSVGYNLMVARGSGAYTSNNGIRTSYITFNVPIEYGYTYLILNEYGTSVYTAFHMYNERALASVANKQSIATADHYDSGWITGDNAIEYTYTPPETLNGSPPGCIRFTFKRSDDSKMQAGDIKKISLYRKVVE